MLPGINVQLTIGWLKFSLVLLILGGLLVACGNEQASPLVSATVRTQTNGVSDITPPPVPVLTATPVPTPDVYSGNVPLLSNPVVLPQNTAYTQNMGADGYNWSQAFPIQVDKYNKIFSIAQNKASNHKFIYSNDGGASWTDSVIEESFLVRGSIAYDSANDKLHLLWAANSVNGIIYRRYDIARDGANNIIAITKDTSINLQLDRQTADEMDYQHPVLFWLNDSEFGSNGALLAMWCAGSIASPATSEIRASMLRLSNSPADGTASSWKAPAGSTPSTMNSVPQVQSSIIFTGVNNVAPYASMLRKTSGKHAKDLYFFYANGANVWEWRRATWNSSTNDWNSSLTPSVVIAKVVREGKDSGYNLKYQLGSKPVEDSVNDRVYFGFASWKDDSSGDTWSHIYIDNNDTLSPIVDAYSAGGSHSYAPTGDLVFDSSTGLIVSAYLKTGGSGTYLQAYNGVNRLGSEILLFNSSEVDIPLLWQGGRYGNPLSAKLLVLFRNTATPYQGYFGTVDWLAFAGVSQASGGQGTLNKVPSSTSTVLPTPK